MLKNISAGIAISAATTLILLVCLEVALRLLGYGTPQALAFDKALGYVPKPNSTITTTSAEFSTTRTINDDGFFGPTIDEVKNSKNLIITIGDSFTEARQVEKQKSYPFALEQQLRSATTTEYRVLNLGRTTSGPKKERYILNRYASDLKPKLVILGLYTGNDFADAEREAAIDYTTPPEDGLLTRIKRSVGLTLLNNTALTNFYLDKKARNVILAKEPIRYIKEATPTRLIKDAKTLFSDNGAVKAVTGPELSSEFDVFFPTLNAKAKKQYQIATSSLLALKQNIDDMGGQLLVAIIPDKTQVYESLRAPEWPQLDYTKPNTILADFFAENNIPYIDALPALQEDYKSSDEYAYYIKDGHFNERGHAILADLIANAIISTTSPNSILNTTE